MGCSALINKDYVKDGAKKFYEWSLSEEAMALYSKNRSLVTSKSKEFIRPEFVKSVNNMIENDLIWQSDNRKSIANDWDKKYGVGE